MTKVVGVGDVAVACVTNNNRERGKGTSSLAAPSRSSRCKLLLPRSIISKSVLRHISTHIFNARGRIPNKHIDRSCINYYNSCEWFITPKIHLKPTFKLHLRLSVHSKSSKKTNRGISGLKYLNKVRRLWGKPSKAKHTSYYA